MPIEIPKTDHTNSFDFWLNILLQIIIINWMGVFLFTYSLAFVIIVTHVLLQAQVIQKILVNVGEWEERVYVRKLQDFFGSCTDEHQFNINNKVLMCSGTSSEAKVSKMSSKIKPIGNDKTFNVLKEVKELDLLYEFLCDGVEHVNTKKSSYLLETAINLHVRLNECVITSSISI